MLIVTFGCAFLLLLCVFWSVANDDKMIAKIILSLFLVIFGLIVFPIYYSIMSIFCFFMPRKIRVYWMEKCLYHYMFYGSLYRRVSGCRNTIDFSLFETEGLFVISGVKFSVIYKNEFIVLMKDDSVLDQIVYPRTALFSLNFKPYQKICDRVMALT